MASHLAEILKANHKSIHYFYLLVLLNLHLLILPCQVSFWSFQEQILLDFWIFQIQYQLLLMVLLLRCSFSVASEERIESLRGKISYFTHKLAIPHNINCIILSGFISESWVLNFFLMLLCECLSLKTLYFGICSK